MRIIILEGPDGAGKTTLAQRLHDKHGYRIIHHGPPTKGEAMFKTFLDSLWAAHRDPGPVVIDRLHLSELVYGQILRGHSQLGGTGVDVLQRAINAIGAQLVICLPPYSDCLDHWRSRQADELVQDQRVFQQIYEQYQKIVASGRWRRLVFNYEATSVKEYAALLAKHVTPNLPPGYVGSPQAQYLVVGERANQEAVDWPFMALNGSSQFLNECLWEAGYTEPELAFVNALKLDGTPNDSPIDDWRGVLALGNTAQEWCADHGLDATPLLHPQYVKRFKAKERWRYVQDLRRAR